MYKKTQTLNDLILWMQDTDDGISLKDIMEKYDVSLRTAVRMKDSIAEKYPKLNEISGPYNTKRWYLPKGTGRDMVSFSMEEIHALQNASKLLASKKMIDSRYIDNVLHKIKALIGKDAINRIEPDAEALLEAEGYAFRPGPRIIINTEHLKQLRYAIIACNRIKIKYDSSHNKDWRKLFPYGFLYGNKHYLIAWDSTKRKMCHFNLNKIKEIEVLNTYFKRDPHFSLKEFSEQAFGVYQEKPFDVEWLFDAEVADSAAQYTFHPKQEAFRNPDGTLTVKFRAGGAREMDWHLYTWGGHVKVIKPEDFDKRKYPVFSELIRHFLSFLNI